MLDCSFYNQGRKENDNILVLQIMQIRFGIIQKVRTFQELKIYLFNKMKITVSHIPVIVIMKQR